jgi:hypothetical protein
VVAHGSLGRQGFQQGLGLAQVHDPVPLGNTIRPGDLRVFGGQAAWVYSLIRPPRTGLRWIRATLQSVMADRGM